MERLNIIEIILCLTCWIILSYAVSLCNISFLNSMMKFGGIVLVIGLIKEEIVKRIKR